MVTNKSISCVVITNGLNNRFLIERTLSSILTTTDTIGWDVEIIVVDNSPEQNIKTILINEGYNNVISKNISYEVSNINDEMILNYKLRKKLKII